MFCLVNVATHIVKFTCVTALSCPENSVLLPLALTIFLPSLSKMILESPQGGQDTDNTFKLSSLQFLLCVLSSFGFLDSLLSTAISFLIRMENSLIHVY